MPLYELRCDTCGHTFEELVFRRSELETLACPRCGAAQVTQLLSACASPASASKGGGATAGGCGGGSGAFR